MYCTTTFDIQKFHVLPTERICSCGSRDKQGLFYNSINGLVFVTVVECVYCTVRSWYFKYIIPINLIIKVRAMAQADSRRPPTMETRVVPR
jgi:hypothetical protein